MLRLSPITILIFLSTRQVLRPCYERFITEDPMKDAGVSATLVSFSATVFWIDTPGQYDKDDLHDYIMDWSGAYTAGAVIGTSVSQPKDLNLPKAFGYGVLSLQVGISVGKTTDRFTNNTSLPVYTALSYFH